MTTMTEEKARETIKDYDTQTYQTYEYFTAKGFLEGLEHERRRAEGWETEYKRHINQQAEWIARDGAELEKLKDERQRAEQNSKSFNALHDEYIDCQKELKAERQRAEGLVEVIKRRMGVHLNHTCRCFSDEREALAKYRGEK